MFRTVTGVLGLGFLTVAVPSFAQENRAEINPFFGYTTSDGVTVDPIAIDGEVYDAVNVKSGGSFGGLSLRF